MRRIPSPVTRVEGQSFGTAPFFVLVALWTSGAFDLLAARLTLRGGRSVKAFLKTRGAAFNGRLDAFGPPPEQKFVPPDRPPDRGCQSFDGAVKCHMVKVCHFPKVKAFRPLRGEGSRKFDLCVKALTVVRTNVHDRTSRTVPKALNLQSFDVGTVLATIPNHDRFTFPPFGSPSVKPSPWKVRNQRGFGTFQGEQSGIAE